MTSAAILVGMDVAKAELEVALRPSAAQWVVPNDARGIATLVARLRTGPRVDRSGSVSGYAIIPTEGHRKVPTLPS